MSNKDTSSRIKRSLGHRFLQGGVFQFPIFGYLKPPDTKCDTDVKRDPDAQAVYDTWFRMLEGGASYSEVADWLNEQGIKPGQYCREGRWTGRMVMRVTFNPILKGQRRRNVKESTRVNKTGRRRSVNAHPDKLLTRHCPHLAFIDADRYDRVVHMLCRRNEGFARGRRRNMNDCRTGLARKRTVWPGQHATCGICNGLFYWGGHGQKDHMMCSRSRDYLCWNAATFDGPAASRRLIQAILAEIETLAEFDSTFVTMVNASREAWQSTKQIQLEKIARELVDVGEKITNVTNAIAAVGHNDDLVRKLNSLGDQRDGLVAKQAELRHTPDHDLRLPTADQIKQEARQAIVALASDSPELGRLMHQLVPILQVYPYRLCDGGTVVLRAILTLDLTTIANVPWAGEEANGVMRRELIVDLFEPPQRVRFREQVIARRAEGMTERRIAAALGITVVAAQKAAKLHRTMQARCLDDPYLPVTEPPAERTRWRRHLHPRYRFEPLHHESAI
jgi:hypothetical protein